MKKLFEEFKAFVTTGNLIAIAIGLLMGVQVGNVVTSFTENLFNPIFSIFGDAESLDGTLILDVSDTKFYFGAFLGDVINFLAVATCAFFIVKASLKVFPPKEVESGPTEVELLTEIRDSLKK